VPGRRLFRMVPIAAVAVASVVAVGWTFAYVAPDLVIPSGFFVDFRINIWEPGRALLDGRDPIREASSEENGGIYPPVALVATLPFALLPYHVAAFLWLLALVAGTVVAMRLCGVRDWRCLALALLSPPVIGGLAYGNVSILMVLALAGIWVSRDRPWRAGVLLGVVLAARFYLWPVLVWFLFTRRLRAAAAVVVSGLLASVIGWGAVKFHRIGEFPEVIRSNASEFLDQGVSVGSIVANLGASPAAAALIASLAGAVALGIGWRQRHDDLAASAGPWQLRSSRRRSSGDTTSR